MPTGVWHSSISVSRGVAGCVWGVSGCLLCHGHLCARTRTHTHTYTCKHTFPFGQFWQTQAHWTWGNTQIGVETQKGTQVQPGYCQCGASGGLGEWGGDKRWGGREKARAVRVQETPEASRTGWGQWGEWLPLRRGCSFLPAPLQSHSCRMWVSPTPTSQTWAGGCCTEAEDLAEYTTRVLPHCLDSLWTRQHSRSGK
jgi:hypothetical protein